MSKVTWESVPTISEQYYSETHEFKKVEDISTEVLITQAQTYVWLKFTSHWTWPGPKARLLGGPIHLRPWYGVRAIPYGSIKVDVQDAFKFAMARMKKTKSGDSFVGSIVMYWPVVAPKVAQEPFYTFTTNRNELIHVGAYTGEVTGG